MGHAPQRRGALACGDVPPAGPGRVQSWHCGVDPTGLLLLCHLLPEVLHAEQHCQSAVESCWSAKSLQSSVKGWHGLFMYDCHRCFQHSAAYHLYHMMLYEGACSRIATDDAFDSNDVQVLRHVHRFYACSTLSSTCHPARLRMLGHSTRHTLVALAYHYCRLPPQESSP